MLLLSLVSSITHLKITGAQSTFLDEYPNIHSNIPALYYEYDQIFGDIVFCGTNITAYPFCSGDTQSPIDIITDQVENGRQVHCNKRPLNWKYRPPKDNEFLVAKVEHFIEVAAFNAANFKNPVKPLPPARNKVKRYCLESLHAHWDSTAINGSEHTVDTKRYPLEAHFVHYNWFVIIYKFKSDL